LPAARRLLLALLATLPLVSWPGLPQPFSTPKLWLLTASLLTLAPFAALARLRRSQEARGACEVLAGVWLASWTWSALFGDVVSIEAIGLAFGTALLAIEIVAIGPAAGQVAGAMVFGATGVAMVAVGQAAGVDPFGLAGWVPPIGGASARLRIYGTLGNPDFVAALLVATTPLTVSLLARQGAARPGGVVRRVALFGALGLQLAAVIATGSRAGALGLFVAAVTWGAVAPGRRRLRLVVATLGCAIAMAAIVVSPARPLGQTVAGRAYIVRVAWPHAFEAPVVGRGPGAFEWLYPGWERAARGEHRGLPPFAGPQQHAHNDYLEALIERGLLGPVTIMIILATCFRNGWRYARDGTQDASIVVGAVAMLAALAAIACVDFPLERPTELTWAWCGVALISLSRSEHADGTLDVDPEDPADRPGDRHDGRGGPRGQDEVLGKT
jgi:putative inorganic carbon (hco3(-)) transporter